MEALCAEYQALEQSVRPVLLNPPIQPILTFEHRASTPLLKNARRDDVDRQTMEQT